MAETHPEAQRTFVRQVLIDLAVMTGIGLMLALIGPFGSFAAPFAWRLIYWVGLAWAGYACYRPIGGLIARLGPQYDLPELPLWIAGCLVATVPMTLVVWLIGSGPGGPQPPSLVDALATYGYVLAVGATITVLFYLFQREPAGIAPLTEPATPASIAALAPPAPRLLDRLPARLGIELVALEMEDHYLRVHTALGSDLILLRMRDALAELEGIEGMQVHRSWWVARAAISEVLRDGRSLRLRLNTGSVVPVARNLVPVLKSAGWF